MKEQLISLKVAKLAKEKGFNIFEYDENLKSAIIYDENSFYVDTAFFKDKYYAYVDEELYLIESGSYDSRYGSFNAMVEEYFKKETNDYFQAPTQSLLQKWLRDVHDIHIKIAFESTWYESYYKKPKGVKWSSSYRNRNPYDTYEEALEKTLQKALKLIKNEN